MGNPETNMGGLCEELGISRQALYRHVGPDGSLRANEIKLLERQAKKTAAAASKDRELEEVEEV